MLNDTFEMSTGQAHEFAMACRRNNLTGADVKLLTVGDNIRRCIDFLNGKGEKSTSSFDPATFIGKGWTILEDRESLSENWDPSKILIESALKSGEQYVTGEETLERFAKKQLLGARAFWYLWNNKDKIPKEWKGKYVFFDATILQGPRGGRAALCLGWSGGRWRWDCVWLGSRRDGQYLSACAR